MPEYQFKFILALALGRTLAEIDKLSASEFTQWMQYYAEHPFDADYKAAGIISSVIANVNRDPKKKSDAYMPEDFMPRRQESEEKRAETSKQMYNYFKMMALG
jgi:hypothetical protein